VASIEEPYDEAIPTLRKRPQAKKALISHFWGPSRPDEFDAVTGLIGEIDHRIRRLNQEFDAVMQGERSANGR